MCWNPSVYQHVLLSCLPTVLSDQCGKTWRGGEALLSESALLHHSQAWKHTSNVTLTDLA